MQKDVRKQQWLVDEEAQSGAVMEFQVYGYPLETVTSFKYLVHLITAIYDYFPEVIVNLQKERNIWYCLSRNLGREGEDPRTLGCFYLTVI